MAQNFLGVLGRAKLGFGVGSISGAWGAWVYEIVADDRSSSPAQIEPVLRLLGPEALRGEGSGPAPLGLVSD